MPKLGFHGLRHTFASILIDEGRNIRQVSALLGHASPSFTLQVYVHLMADDAGGPLDLDAALAPASLLSTETTGPTAAVRVEGVSTAVQAASEVGRHLPPATRSPTPADGRRSARPSTTLQADSR